MPWAQHDGARLFHRQSGADGPPLVLIHGFACDHGFLAPQAEHFAPRHRVLSLDLPGHGQSDKPRRRLSIESFADDTAWLCRHLGLSRVTAVGHSLGGAVALEMAVRHPELVRAVACLDSALISSRERREKGLPALLAALQGPDHRQAMRSYFGGMFLPSDGEEFRERVLGVMSQAPRHLLVSLTRALMAWDGGPALGRLAAPLLYVGAARPLTPLETLRAAAPQALLGQVVGAGHFLTLLAAPQVNAMLERFLELLPWLEKAR